jgi:hypothetical protein
VIHLFESSKCLFLKRIYRKFVHVEENQYSYQWVNFHFLYPTVMLKDGMHESGKPSIWGIFSQENARKLALLCPP